VRPAATLPPRPEATIPQPISPARLATHAVTTHQPTHLPARQPARSMDVPKGPQLLGRFFGSCVGAGFASLDLLPQLMEGEGAVEPKRRFSAAAFKAIRAAKGDAGLTGLCKETGLAASSFLTGDPEFDKDEPALDEWLKSEGLTGLVPV
jgi:translation initiation factor 4G